MGKVGLGIDLHNKFYIKNSIQIVGHMFQLKKNT